MRVVSIEDVKSLEAKESIPSVQGTLTKIYPRKTGENAQGSWSMQNGMLQDSTGEMKILFTNQPDAKGFQNREILIKSHVGDKGMSGVYAHDDNYQGTASRIIKITATGEISLVDGSAPKQSPPSTAKTAQSSSNPVQALKDALGPIRNAFYVIEAEIKTQCDQSEISGIPFDVSNFGGKCSAAARLVDPALIRGMPVGPLWSVKSGAEQAATDGDAPW